MKKRHQSKFRLHRETLHLLYDSKMQHAVAAKGVTVTRGEACFTEYACSAACTDSVCGH